MANGNAIVYPGVLPAGTPTLGNVELAYVQPIPDASHHWSSRQLKAGPLLEWKDRVSGVVMAPPSQGQAPDVYPGMRKVIRFDGAPERLGVTLNLKGPITVAYVAQVTDTGLGRSLTYGLEGGTFWNIYQGTNGNWAFSGGKTLSTTKPADDSRHVFLITYDGASSVFRVDDQEWAGDAGNTPAAGFRIGSNASQYFKMDLEAVVVLPFAADASRRTRLVTQLKKEHGFVF